jgi:hypothetical protein
LLSEGAGHMCGWVGVNHARGVHGPPPPPPTHPSQRPPPRATSQARPPPSTTSASEDASEAALAHAAADVGLAAAAALDREVEQLKREYEERWVRRPRGPGVGSRRPRGPGVGSCWPRGAMMGLLLVGWWRGPVGGVAAKCWPCCCSSPVLPPQSYPTPRHRLFGTPLHTPLRVTFPWAAKLGCLQAAAPGGGIQRAADPRGQGPADSAAGRAAQRQRRQQQHGRGR